jgi:hypothetical protein
MTKPTRANHLKERDAKTPVLKQLLLQESGVAEAGSTVPTPPNGVGFLALIHINSKLFYALREATMSRLKPLPIMLLVIFFSCSTLFSATFTECHKNVCAIITVPDNVVADESFEMMVEGYLQGGSSWETTSYMFLRGFLPSGRGE